MARFSDINKGPELADAYAKMQIWRAKSRAAKRTDYIASRSKPTTARWQREKGYILPFNSMGVTTFFETMLLDTTQTISPDRAAAAARNLASDFVVTLAQLPGTGVTTFKVPKYTFAKIMCSDRDGTGVQKQSRLTDIPYLQYRTFGASSPIGRNQTAPATSQFAAVVVSIKANAAYDGFLTQEGSRISIIPERG